jgi:hypothetical protein
MLCGRRSPDDSRADMLGYLSCGNTDAATHRVNEYGLAALEPAHDDAELPGGEIVDRNRGAFPCRHALGTLEHLSQGNANYVGIAAEARQREDVASRPTRIDAGAECVDAAADLVARHDRNRRQVGIEPKPTQNVGEVDPARLDPDADFSCFRFWIRRFLELQHLRRAGSRDPNLPHG